MGVMGDAIAAYSQTLIDKTDGSMEEINIACKVSTICWNLSLLPESEREAPIAAMQSTLEMENEEFIDFRNTVVFPMIQRHKEMFPTLHLLNSMESPRKNAEPKQPKKVLEPFIKAHCLGRNEPCSCNSGKKFKQCCGK